MYTFTKVHIKKRKRSNKYQKMKSTETVVEISPPRARSEILTSLRAACEDVSMTQKEGRPITGHPAAFVLFCLPLYPSAMMSRSLSGLRPRFAFIGTWGGLSKRALSF